MAKDKRSFFERLTGSISVEDEFETPADAKRITVQGKGKNPEWPIEETEAEGQLSVDVFQTPMHIILKTMVAGVRPEDLDISITRDMVTVRGKREEQKEVTEDDYFFKELYWGSFSRTVLLPHEVDVEMAEAIERHGLLIIKLPKIDKGRQTKLKVKSN